MISYVSRWVICVNAEGIISHLMSFVKKTTKRFFVDKNSNFLELLPKESHNYKRIFKYYLSTEMHINLEEAVHCLQIREGRLNDFGTIKHG